MARVVTDLLSSASKLCAQGQLGISTLLSNARNGNVSALTSLRSFTSLSQGRPAVAPCMFQSQSLLQRKQENVSTTQVRTTTVEMKQWREGRVISRFYRLNWGGWIRTFGGRSRKLYMKTSKERWRLRQHVFVTKKQCKMLDKLVTEQWREPKFYVENAEYDPYHKRTNSYHFPNHRKFYP
ncbi:39S ribosomal protein L35, mitochondrial [Aplysia californica]|uniref:Large ribosomal subunit protein bL35m n=1 Tax=Aplysia californica TaxID=6500 RepID=A0ABM0JYV0_APLCA|nr:39S ribosomal protein L35, mitochondrial [Aplysia californica]